jgi:hypothetical protein
MATSKKYFQSAPAKKSSATKHFARCELASSERTTRERDFGRRSVGVGGLPVNIISVHEFFPPPGAALMEEQKVFMLIEIAPKKSKPSQSSGDPLCQYFTIYESNFRRAAAFSLREH